MSEPIEPNASEGRPKYDEELIQITGDLAKSSVDRIFRHLRDAREAARHADDPMFARITVILAAASLESNLSHLTARALAIAAVRPAMYSREQMEYLRGTKTVVTDRGSLKEVPMRQGLEERLQLVPDLLARAFDRRYESSKTNPRARARGRWRTGDGANGSGASPRACRRSAQRCHRAFIVERRLGV